MDLSKLPKLSHSPPPPNNDDPDSTTSRPAGQSEAVPGAAPPRAVSREPGVGAEAWISIAIGVILLLVSQRFLDYLFSPSTFSQKWTFTDTDGSPLPYTKSVFFWGDLAIVAFGLVLILDGLVIALRSRWALVAFAFMITLLAVLINLIYVAAMMQMGYGLQLFSALAVAFGGYIALVQWRLIQGSR